MYALYRLNDLTKRVRDKAFAISVKNYIYKKKYNLKLLEDKLLFQNNTTTLNFITCSRMPMTVKKKLILFSFTALKFKRKTLFLKVRINYNSYA